MDSGIFALLILAALVISGASGVLMLFRWLNRRYYRNLLRGNLREDYIRKNPDLVRGNNIWCSCGNDKIALRNLGLMRMEGSDIVREHVCHQCGARLFFSTGGDYLQKITEELRKEAGIQNGVQTATFNG